MRFPPGSGLIGAATYSKPASSPQAYGLPFHMLKPSKSEFWPILGKWAKKTEKAFVTFQ